jgi:hypothetical protein
MRLALLGLSTAHFGPPSAIRAQVQLLGKWRFDRRKRYGKAYLDGDGDPALDMDVEVAGGVATENLRESIDTWRAVLGMFRRSLSDKRIVD